MRPLNPPSSKTHGIIHTVRVSRENLEQVADQLGIPEQAKQWIQPGHQLHIVREADESELDRNKE